MATLNRNFISGKMNIDLDDRLIQPGTYRRGQNISVSRSDGADIGALESIRGNVQIIPGNNLQLNSEVVILGSTVDRLNDKVYWYFVGDRTEGVYELDVSLDEDGNPKDTISRILEFSINKGILNFNVKNLITGSAVISDLLVWTDGLNPIRKININRLRGSGNYYLPSEDRNDGGFEYTLTNVESNDSEVFVYTQSATPVITDRQFVITDEHTGIDPTGVLQGNDEIGYTYDEETKTVTLNTIPEGGSGTLITVNYKLILFRASVKSKKDVLNTVLITSVNPEYDGEGNELISLFNPNYNAEPFAAPDVRRGANAPNDQAAFPGDLINLGKRAPLQPPILLGNYTQEKVTPNNALEETFVYFAL